MDSKNPPRDDHAGAAVQYLANGPGIHAEVLLGQVTRRMWGVNVTGPDQPEEMVASNRTHEQIPRFMLNYKKRAEMLREPLLRAWKSWIV